MSLTTVVPAESRAARVALSHMEEVLIRPAWCITTILTHKDLGASLAVSILLMYAMNLSHMGLQRATLCESFLTQLTLVGTDTCSSERQKTVSPLSFPPRVTLSESSCNDWTQIFHLFTFLLLISVNASHFKVTVNPTKEFLQISIKCKKLEKKVTGLLKVFF